MTPRPQDSDLVIAAALRTLERLERGELVAPAESYVPRDFSPTREIALTLVGAGWNPLLNEAFAAAEREGVRIDQVKEKFGGLRVNWGTTRDRDQWERVWGLSRELEVRSLLICEACGAPGELRKENFWWKTLCDRHAEMRRQGRSWREIFGFQPYTTPMN